jgi:hypothetical protein
MKTPSGKNSGRQLSAGNAEQAELVAVLRDVRALLQQIAKHYQSTVPRGPLSSYVPEVFKPDPRFDPRNWAEKRA